MPYESIIPEWFRQSGKSGKCYDIAPTMAALLNLQGLYQYQIHSISTFAEGIKAANLVFTNPSNAFSFVRTCGEWEIVLSSTITQLNQAVVLTVTLDE